MRACVSTRVFLCMRVDRQVNRSCFSPVLTHRHLNACLTGCSLRAGAGRVNSPIFTDAHYLIPFRSQFATVCRFPHSSRIHRGLKGQDAKVTLKNCPPIPPSAPSPKLAWGPGTGRSCGSRPLSGAVCSSAPWRGSHTAEGADVAEVPPAVVGQQSARPEAARGPRMPRGRGAGAGADEGRDWRPR